MPGSKPQRSPTEAIDRAATAVRAVELPPDGDGDRVRAEILSVLERFLLPRAADPASPLNVVFVGPTGSGKSTLINSVMGRPLSPSGYLRPTTSDPLVCLGHDSTLTISLTDPEVVRGGAGILDDVTFVDTPDIDSTEVDHRLRAMEAVAGADIVIFVASASRYGDLEPWKILRAVGGRRTPIIHVVNRVTSGSAGAVTDYRRRLRNEGIGGPVLRIAEHQETSGDMIPAASVRNLRRAILEEVRSIRPEERFDSTVDHVIGALGELRSKLLEARQDEEQDLVELRAEPVVPDLTAKATGWAEDLHENESGLLRFISRRRQVGLVEIFERVTRELTIGIESRIERLLASLGADREVISGARRTATTAVMSWLDDIEPSGDFHKLTPPSKARKLSNVIDILRRNPNDPNSEIFDLQNSLSDIREGALSTLATTAAVTNVLLVEEAMEELRRTRPLAAAVNA